MTTVKHYDDGSIKFIFVENENYKPHNDNGPAHQCWYPNGQENYRSYNLNGLPHNENGPANQEWYKNGQERSRFYCLNGILHNENGPAAQFWYENGKEWYRAYYLNGKKLTKEEFYELKNTVEVHANGKTVRISKQSAKELEVI